MFDTIYDQIFKRVRKSRKILCLTHQRPDADALGSGLAIVHWLKDLGKDVEMVVLDQIPANLQHLPGVDLIQQQLSLRIFEFDLIIITDCSDLDNISASDKVKRYLSRAKEKIITFDHHLTSTEFGSLNLVNRESAATCELLFEFFQYQQIPISLEMAYLLMAGLIDDTGSFCHSNTTSKTLAISGQLQEAGLNLSKITQKLYNNKSLSALRLRGLVLERLRRIPKLQMVISYITDRDLRRFQVTCDDLEGLATLISSDPETKIALLLSQRGDQIKGSLRTQDHQTDVAKIASLFGGGGHQKAAGFNFDGHLKIENGNLVVV